MPAVLRRVWRIEPAWWLSLGFVAMAFSGNWERFGVPVSIERVLLLVGVVTVLLRAGTEPDIPPVRLRLIHLLLLAVVFYGIASAAWVGTLDEEEPRFALLDRLGLVPFLAFAVAPAAFAMPHQRQILIRVLVGFGLYLGVTAILERLDADALVWPGYIMDPDVGIHVDRSRGPFVQAEANGLAMAFCAVSACIGLATWRSRATRLLAWGVLGLCLAGILLTYTRLVWGGVAGGAILAAAVFPVLRSRLIVSVALGAGAVAAALALVPGLEDDISDRVNDKKPVWTRQATNDAALRMISERPVFGWGWATFPEESPEYFRTIEDIRYSGIGEDVHNTFLSRFVELGLVGGGLWLIAVMLALGGALLRPHEGDLELFRMGFCILLFAMLVAGMLSPLSTIMPLFGIWLWAGILAQPSVTGGGSAALRTR